MKVGIYVQPARYKELTGVGRHIRKLIEHLPLASERSDQFLLYYPSVGREDLGFTVPDNRFQPRPVRVPSNWEGSRPNLWWNWRLPISVLADRLDVFHGPSHYLPRSLHKRTVTTIHDLAYFQMSVHSPGHDELQRRLTLTSLKRAGKVIALSENTKRDVLALDFPDDRVDVIYGGGDIAGEDTIQENRWTEVADRYDIDAPYILFVGSINQRKNVPHLIQAFARLIKDRNHPHLLVVVGGDGGGLQEARQVASECGCADRVRFTGFIDDWERPLIFRHADIFGFPSKYEGFTLVTIEAMAYGIPVVAIDSSSVTEGVGNAARLVKTDESEDFASEMNLVLGSRELANEMVREGKKQAQKFSWESNARATMSLYQSLAGH